MVNENYDFLKCKDKWHREKKEHDDFRLKWQLLKQQQTDEGRKPPICKLFGRLYCPCCGNILFISSKQEYYDEILLILESNCGYKWATKEGYCHVGLY